MMDASAYMEAEDVQRIKQRMYYLRNREKCIERVRDYKRRQRARIRQLKEAIRDRR